MAKRIALLRGINVGGRNKVPMAQLKALAEGLGWKEVKSFIQSGNLVFEAAGSGEALERALEQGVEKRFDIQVPVMVRSASQWAAILEANPFPDEAAADPARLLVGIPKRPPAKGAAEAIECRAAAGERVREAGGVLWIHYPQGAGQSKITPAMIDKAAGSPVTARNWRTVIALQDLVEA
jgi:uncharacterized protein (DUF1697 family)